MSTDAMKWIDDERSCHKLDTGRDMTTAELSRGFQRLGPTQRAVLLTDLKNKIEDSDFSVEKAAELYRWRRALNDAHQAARRVNR